MPALFVERASFVLHDTHIRDGYIAHTQHTQVLCHSMLRVYHTRKVFTPIQIAKAIICSWPVRFGLSYQLIGSVFSFLLLPSELPSSSLSQFNTLFLTPTNLLSLQFVANVPSIWAAIIESPNPSPRDPSFPPIGFPPTHTGRTGLGGPSPNDPAAAAAAAVVAPLASFPSASSLATLPGACQCLCVYVCVNVWECMCLHASYNNNCLCSET